jgi:hypothetical protein
LPIGQSSFYFGAISPFCTQCVELALFAQGAAPPESTAQQLTSALMREIYLTFALWTAGISVGIWVCAPPLSFADVTSIDP